MYNDKVVLITGGSTGIGKHLVEAYANLDAKVISLDILDGAFENPNIDFFRGDLSNEKEIKDVFTKITEKYGTIHILINNGAISKFNKPVNDITFEEFTNVINVNLNGAFLCSQEFIKANAGQSYGRIINIASTRWKYNQAGWEAYGASKGGIVSLSNTLAISLSNTPITVNTVSPGWIQVYNYDSLDEKAHRIHPSGRVGKPKDIVNACLFLTNIENDFVNATNIVVDGGLTKKLIFE